MDGFLKYLISKFGELFSLLWYHVYKWIDRKIPYGVVVVTASLTVETKFLLSSSRLKTGCKGVYIFRSFCCCCLSD